MTEPNQIEQIVEAEGAQSGYIALTLQSEGAFDTMSAQDKLIRACASQLEYAADQAPEWFAYFEDSQAFSAPREDVLELMRTAPTPFAAGLMYGIFLMRQELAVMTGRDFV